jgi:hypothetical protein
VKVKWEGAGRSILLLALKLILRVSCYPEPPCGHGPVPWVGDMRVQILMNLPYLYAHLPWTLCHGPISVSSINIHMTNTYGWHGS